MIEQLIEDRINASYAEMSRQLNTALYGDPTPFRERGKVERLKYWLSRHWRRISDAWLVLTGQASLDDY